MNAFPPAMLLGLWLNAAHTRSVSPTDAANALEVITNQVDLSLFSKNGSQGASWLELVQNVISAEDPVAVGLPVTGDPAGVPADVLKKISADSGVVAINRNQILYQDSDGVWVLINETNNVMHYDLSQTRRNLLAQVSDAANELANSDLVGEETEVITALDSFQAMHIPPHLSKRSTDSIELAARIKIIAQGAIANTHAVHSPSTDRRRLQILENLIVVARSVLQSVITT